MNIVIMITLMMMMMMIIIIIIIIIIIMLNFKATPNTPLRTQRGNRGVALPKPDINATWLKINGGNHRKKI